MSKIVESQPPPAPIWDSAPARVSVAAATTVRPKVCVAVVEALSATRTVKLYVPAVVGVPVIAPALESASPGGRVPDVIVQVYGETPPLAVSVCEYVPLVNPDTRGEDVVIVSGGGLIVRLKVWVATLEAESVTRTVKLYVPAPVGVPVIAPALESASPAGRAPDEIAHVYGGVPPLAASVCEYAVPVDPDGRGELVVIISSATTVRLKVLVAVVEALSVTLTVKL